MRETWPPARSIWPGIPVTHQPLTHLVELRTDHFRIRGQLENRRKGQMVLRGGCEEQALHEEKGLTTIMKSQKRLAGEQEQATARP